jgi:hypothetical protein
MELILFIQVVIIVLFTIFKSGDGDDNFFDGMS